MLHRLLLLPLLSPLLAVLLVAAINPKPWVKLRLLTWTSTSWPLGAWMASAAGLGAALSSAGAALALQGSAMEPTPRRQVRRRAASQADDAAGGDDTTTATAPTDAWMPQPAPGWAGPSRSATEPAPTVSVPFRVIRKGSRPAESEAPPSQPQASQPAPSSDDDWGSPVSDDW